MITFLATIFGPPEQMLTQANSFLQNLAMVSAAGINVSDYFSWLGILDPAWQQVVDSFLSGVVLIGTIWIARAIYRSYLSLKQGVQWW